MELPAESGFSIMKPNALYIAAVGLIFLSACSKEEAVETKRFDAKVIAAEADRGNLGPLTELNSECSTEVEKNGRRMAVCKVQDEVRDLRKPLSIRF